MNNFISSKKSFTLIELLVVIAIIGILSGFILVSLSSATNAAKDAKVKSDISSIQSAIMAYDTQNSVSYPSSETNCTLGGGTNRCTTLEGNLSPFLTVFPENPNGGYYTYNYISATETYTLSGDLSNKNQWSYFSLSASWREERTTADIDGSCIVSSGTLNLNTQSCSGRATADAVNFISTANTSSGSTSITLSSSPVGIAVGDQILIINLQGTSGDYANVGKYETKIISEINSNTLTFFQPLTNSYNGTTQKIMIQRLPNYDNVSVASGAILTANAWNGTQGGVLAFVSSGQVNILGTINMAGKGYSGGLGNGAGRGDTSNGQQGESIIGIGSYSTSSNNNGGGGAGCDGNAGAGGGYTNNGSNASLCPSCYSRGSCPGSGGVLISTSSRLYLGSGGGGGGGTADSAARYGGNGGNGGGIIFITANNVSVEGLITAAGLSGGNGGGSGGTRWGAGGGGGGSGGIIKVSGTIQYVASGSSSYIGGTGGYGCQWCGGGIACSYGCGSNWCNSGGAAGANGGNGSNGLIETS
jgi:prepilin-type N-terminal cleavage/methylation domain-containing protein